jgi:hypothetical protein
VRRRASDGGVNAVSSISVDGLLVLAAGAALSAGGDLVAVTALQVWAAQSHGALLVVCLLLVPAGATLLGGRAAGALCRLASVKHLVVVVSTFQGLLYLLLSTVGSVPLILVCLGVDAFLALVRSAAVMSAVPEMSERSASKSFGLLQAATTLGRLVALRSARVRWPLGDSPQRC